MSNIRREKTREKLGFDTEKIKKKEEKIRLKALEKQKKRELWRQSIEEKPLYKVLIKGAIGFDIADALLGLLEMVGDLFSGIIGLSYVILYIFTVKSLRLTVAVLAVMLVDLIIGLIPGIGTIVDFVFCGNYINRSMIKGYVEDDPVIKRRVNIISFIGIFVIVGSSFALTKLIMKCF